MSALPLRSPPSVLSCTVTPPSIQPMGPVLPCCLAPAPKEIPSFVHSCTHSVICLHRDAIAHRSRQAPTAPGQKHTCFPLHAGAA